MATTNDPVEKIYAAYNVKRVDRGLTPIDPEDFEMQDPVVFSGPQSTLNTKIQLLPKLASNAFGTINLFYDRVNLDTLVTPRIVKGSATTVFEALPAINEELGIVLEERDVVDGSLGANDFTLTATPVNKIFTGSKVFTYYP